MDQEDEADEIIRRLKITPEKRKMEDLLRKLSALEKKAREEKYEREKRDGGAYL